MTQAGLRIAGKLNGGWPWTEMHKYNTDKVVKHDNVTEFIDSF